MLFTGIDWADDHHDVCLMDPTAKVVDRFRIDHDAAGFQTLHARLAKYSTGPGDVLVALETGRGLLVHELVTHGYQVYVINPKAVDRYKDRHCSSGAKDDKIDAKAMADLLRTDRHLHRPLVLMPEQYQELDALCLDLRKLVDDQTRVSNQLTDCLKQFYPQAVGLFSVASSPINIAFLRAFPDPMTLKATDRPAFEAFFKAQHYTRPQRIEELYQKAQAAAPIPSKAALRRGQMRLSSLVDQLETLRNHIRRYEKEIRQILDEMPEVDTISSLPGAGPRLVPEITAALGPNMKDAPQRFASAKELARLSGSVPITKQSGRYKSVQARRACVKPMRRTFYDLAEKSISLCAWAKAFYQHYSNQGKRHATIIRNLAAKWIKIVFYLWKTGTLYDEVYYIAQLKKNDVVWAHNL